MDTEPPETRARLKDLLRSRVSPLLGGMIVSSILFAIGIVAVARARRWL